jgi:hypothetical protein
MLADPYAAYARLRATDPVHWHAPQEAWLLTRYADVDAALRDARLSNGFGTAIQQAAGAGWQTLRDIFAFVSNSLVFSDPPRHTRLRGLVSRAFTAADDRRHAPAHPGAPERPARTAGGARADGSRWRPGVPVPPGGHGAPAGVPRAGPRSDQALVRRFLVPFGRDPNALPPDELEAARRSGQALGRTCATWWPRRARARGATC